MTTKKTTAKKAATRKSLTDGRFKYIEADVIKFLNIPRSVIENLRKRERNPIPESTYKAPRKGVSAVYDEGGFNIICSQLGLCSADMKKLYEEKRVLDHKGHEWAIVTNNRLPSGHAVKAQLCESGEIVIVEVGPRGSDAAVQFRPDKIVLVRDLKDTPPPRVGQLVKRRRI